MVDRSQSPKRKLSARDVSDICDLYSSSQMSVPASMPTQTNVDGNTTRKQDLETFSTLGALKRRSIDSSAVEANIDRPEKRRKMSAAAKHVDVGVISTDEDSS